MRIRTTNKRAKRVRDQRKARHDRNKIVWYIQESGNIPRDIWERLDKILAMRDEALRSVTWRPDVHGDGYQTNDQPEPRSVFVPPGQIFYTEYMSKAEFFDVYPPAPEIEDK